MSVCTQPGSTAFTRMPCSPRLRADALASMLMAPLVPQYAVCPGAPTWAEIELTQQIAPPCPSEIICFARLGADHPGAAHVGLEQQVEVLDGGLVPRMNGLTAALDTT